VRILNGEWEVAFAVDPYSRVSRCGHAVKDRAVEHIGRVRALSEIPGVLAHDWEWYEANKGGLLSFLVPRLNVHKPNYVPVRRCMG
jgi:hypothetical protein